MADQTSRDGSTPTFDTVDAGELPSLLHADHDVAPGTAVGRYIVLHTLGEGGSGVVYTAYDPKLDRKVALKLVRPTPRNHARLLREAQALARLSHPNVVSVHDVGSVDNRVFVAMELVEGMTLRQWLRAGPRNWKDVLRVHLDAANGLVAAHERGLVHRDFKPDNVLVGNDGMVRVVDFGLATKADSQAEDGEPIQAAEGDRLALHLTQVGGVMGTPGYMAPEQYKREPADVRTDQFAFCATLFESLYGVLPFAGSTFDELSQATCRGELAQPVSTRRVPPFVQRAIQRGLSVDPAQRWESMRALLSTLRHDRAAALRRAAGAALLVLAVAATGLLIVQLRSQRERTCSGAEQLIEPRWNARTEASITRAFAAERVPYAQQAERIVITALNDFARGWAVARRDACLATHVRGEQSEEVLSVRLACFDEKLTEFHAVAALMAAGGREVVQRAVEAAARLPRVAECADIAALTSPSGVPGNPRIRDAVSALRLSLADARAQLSAGKYQRAVGMLEGLAPEGQAIGFRPVQAELLVELGNAQLGAGEYGAAEESLRRAEELAEECRHDVVRGRALIDRIEVTGRWLGHYQQAGLDARRAITLARRLRRPDLEWAALDASARVHGYLGELDVAVDEARRSVELARKLFGESDLRLARAHGTYSIALAEVGRLDEASREDQRGLAIHERLLGRAHPSFVRLLLGVAIGLVWAERPAEAVPYAEQALALGAGELGTQHPHYAMAWNVLGYAQLALGNFEQALGANQRSLEIHEPRGQGSSESVYPLVGIGEALLGLGRASEALPALKNATRIADAHGLDAETMGDCHFHYGRALALTRGERAAAVAQVERAVREYGRVPRLASAQKRARAWLRGGEVALAALATARPADPL